MIRILIFSLGFIVMHGAARADPCRDHIAARAAAAHVGTAIYWDGRKRDFLVGSEVSAASGTVLVYYLAQRLPTSEDLKLPAGVRFDDKDGHLEERGACGDTVRTWSFVAGSSRGSGNPGTGAACSRKELVSVADYVAEYRSPSCNKFEENSGVSIAQEAVQILGQIVVDRASEAAYSLLRRRAKSWLKCTDQRLLPATCALIDALRLQDLAMAPDQLRASLAIDALGLIDLLQRKTLSSQTTSMRSEAIQPVFAASSEAPSAAADTPSTQCNKPGEDLRCTVNKLLADHVVPALARPVSRLTGHPAEVMIRRLVDKGLNELEDQGEAKLCTLQHRERILADVAVAFATCKVTSSECQIMNVVELFDRKCQSRLDDDELGYAQSIAGHFWQAVTLDKNLYVPDDAKRLVAALEGSFEVACMYAGTEGGPYKCELQQDKQTDTPLEAYESVAIARDVMLAAAMRDGAALGRAFIAAAGRVLPDADGKDVSKGLRVLATLTAYAATYTGGGESSEAAHKQRTAMLESLTKDMTARTERQGDTIASFGGSLRVMGGRRISHSHKDPSTMKDVHDYAWTPPLVLPLGFAIDYLRDREDGGGFHIELGLLDLGQYLAWDEGGKVATPDLTSALSPSLTIGYSWCREFPFVLGATVGYTPSFDFDASDGADRKGAFNLGVTFGVYVPLFDFN